VALLHSQFAVSSLQASPDPRKVLTLQRGGLAQRVGGLQSLLVVHRVYVLAALLEREGPGRSQVGRLATILSPLVRTLAPLGQLLL